MNSNRRLNSAALVMAAGSLVLSVFAIQLVRTSQERAASEVWEALRPMYSDAGLHMPDKTPETVAEMKRELERVKNEPDAVFFDAWVQARAEAF